MRNKNTQFSPEVILQFLFADAASDPARAAARNEFWFNASSETDALIRKRIRRGGVAYGTNLRFLPPRAREG